MIFEGEYEQLVFCNDSSVGLKAIISMHSTALGPATGGCRMWDYKNEEDALTDVLRLSKGMTYKAAISGLNWGGGKAVIIGDSRSKKTPEHAGSASANTSSAWAEITLRQKTSASAPTIFEWSRARTPHVLGIDGEKSSSGDPSPATAWGVYHGMLRLREARARAPIPLRALKVAIQGLGSVAYSCSSI